jgi:ribonuclease R
MKCFAIVSHYYQGKTVCFPLCHEKKIIYCEEYAPIYCKVLIDLYNNKIIKVGKDINDNSDDDEFLIDLYNLEEIFIKKSPNDPYDRKNIENIFTLTIDPQGSKDLDDALSIDDDKLYIHIADVTSYLQQQDIDKILKRGNTFYLRNSNVPLLSRELSDDIISLLPNCQKRAITLEFNLNDLSLDSWYPSFIYNNYQLSYEDFDNILDGRYNNYCQDTINTILKLEKCYQKFKVKNRINVNNSSISHKIIEEFMIHANKSIANILENSLYRHHALPYANKAGYLQRFIGYQLNRNVPLDINTIRDLTEIIPQKKTLNYLTKHMMSKAIYTTENKSHWALNENYYTHFTSPIRRASDIIVHYDLLRNTKYIKNKSEYITEMNNSEDIQNNIEMIINELDKRRNLKLGEYNSCIVKVNTKGIECYIPDIDYVNSFHISQCSENEYLEYENGQLISDNYHYYLGKCLTLNLEKKNLNSGKLQFNIQKEIEEKELL